MLPLFLLLLAVLGESHHLPQHQMKFANNSDNTDSPGLRPGFTLGAGPLEQSQADIAANKLSMAHRVFNTEQSDCITVPEGDLRYVNEDELQGKLSALRYVKVSDLAFILRSLTPLKRSGTIQRNRHSVSVLLKYAGTIRPYSLEVQYFSDSTPSNADLRAVRDIYVSRPFFIVSRLDDGSRGDTLADRLVVSRTAYASYIVMEDAEQTFEGKHFTFHFLPNSDFQEQEITSRERASMWVHPPPPPDADDA